MSHTSIIIFVRIDRHKDNYVFFFSRQASSRNKMRYEIILKLCNVKQNSSLMPIKVIFRSSR